jgi:hypothetical protein
MWSQITVKWMISDNLDTSGMMKFHNKVNQEHSRVFSISSATCTNFGLSCFRHPVNSCQKSPNQPWQRPVKVLKYPQLYQLLAHVPGKALSDAQSILAKSHSSAINQWYVMWAVTPCFYFLWSLCSYFVWLSTGSDCLDSNLCKTTDIVRINVEINCYTEHWHLPLVLAAYIRFAIILFHQTHILCKSAVKVSSEIVSNLVNSRGRSTYSSMYQLVMTSTAECTAICTRVCTD